MLSRNIQITLFSTCICISLLANIVIAADEDEEERPKSCYEYTGNFLRDTGNTLLKCVANFNPKNIFEYATRFYCILKCLLQEFGTVNQEGKFDDIAAAFFFEENFAPEVQETLLPSVQSCFSLAEQFDDNDYWCKTYSPFITCLVKALVPANLAYSGNCFTSPIISIVFSAFTAITPDPIFNSEMNELKRMMSKQRQIKCFNRNCTTKYKIEKKKNGVSEMIFYDRNMTEISRKLKSSKNSTLVLKEERSYGRSSLRSTDSFDRYL